MNHSFILIELIIDLRTLYVDGGNLAHQRLGVL